MSKQNRRQFLIATTAVGLASTIPGRTSEQREMLGGLYRGAGLQLELTNLSCGSRNAVRITSVQDLPSHGFKQFVLNMEGVSSQQLPEGLYRACSETGVDMAIHIMPTGGNQYAAYFTRAGCSAMVPEFSQGRT
jgi:hypothetical protein